MTRRVVILGGTGEAVRLARLLEPVAEIEVVSSLAGRTRHPAQVPGQVRTGGFGGIAGLTEYLRAQDIRFLVDATHPYADNISANAVAACAACGVPRLQLWRKPWQRVEGDEWIETHSMAEAADVVETHHKKSQGRVFLTTGVQELGFFRELDGVDFLVRLIEKPTAPLPLEHAELIFGRGPFSESGEHALLTERNVTLLVSKNSGGEATYGKITAARDLRIPVVMIGRPSKQPGPLVHSPEDAFAYVVRYLA